jgi:NitT/TauT family transport system ATP-binding protein
MGTAYPFSGRIAFDCNNKSQVTEARTGVGLRLERIRRAFDDLVVIADLTLNIDAGEFLAILGPSGCGKSTLLRIVAGLIAPDSGSLDITPSGANHQTAFVFQDAHLLPWRTVLDNALLPLELMGMEKAERTARARAALNEVGLSDAESRYPAQLSGGMRMRVSLARALVIEPRLLLLDEPFAALDEITRFRLDVRLRDLWIERGMTVIFVTHSITEAAFLADRAVVLMRKGGGIRLDRRLSLPRTRTNELRLSPQLAREMETLLHAMEEET